jgi:predicted secreted hydrolase
MNRNRIEKQKALLQPYILASGYYNNASEVTSVIDHQEHTHAFAYWEGAMRFTGDNARGMGYLEMTGY